MKIKGTTLEVSNIGDFEKIESKIDGKDLGLALTMVSKNLYSNPIGSFIRELTSNAVDANVDADITEAVLVHSYKEGDGYYMEFKDNGTGMSPDTFKNVYMSWFNSDKRDSDVKIGGWGLGSKSPLSYQDSFEVITRQDGIEYHYVLINEGTQPDATLLNKNKTSEPNGTTIRVELKEDDLDKVYLETTRQLAYFRNVYVKNDLKYYNNNFKLYEAEDYILRSVNQPCGDEMHICLGQVAYPINWNVLNIKPVLLPVAIKFEIGELDVTLSREAINYTEEVKTVILKKVKKVTEILLEKYRDQLQISNFKSYLKVIDDTSKPAFTIEDVSISMTGFTVAPKFTPLPNIKIVKKHLRDLFCFYTVTEIRSGRQGTSKTGSLDYFTGHWNNLSSYIVTDRMNTYDSLYIGNNVGLLKRQKIDKGNLIRIAKGLGLLANKKEYEDGFNVKPIFTDGYIKTVFEFVKYVDEYASDYFTHYNGIASPEWIENYKREQQELYAERKQEITHYNIYNNRKTVNWGELMDRNKAIFYISKKEDKETIIAYEHLYSLLPEYFRRSSVFLILNPSVITKIRKKRKFVAAERIFKIAQFNNTLYRIKLASIIKTEFPKRTGLMYSKYYYTMYRELSNKYFCSLVVEKDDVPFKMENYTTTKTISVNIISHFQEEFSTITPSKHRKFLQYEENLEELYKVRDKLDVLNYLSSDCPHNHKVKIIGKLGVLNLDARYYKKD